jgi:OFA family oxalate/formate antiporter-like MFS transporter
LATLAFVILLCYGGGFGTMPSFATDYFGARDIGSIYGLMLTAWGAAAVAGPTFIAHVRQSSGGYQGALKIMAVMTLLSTIVPLLLHPPVLRRTAPASESHLPGASRRIAW